MVNKCKAHKACCLGCAEFAWECLSFKMRRWQESGVRRVHAQHAMQERDIHGNTATGGKCQAVALCDGLVVQHGAVAQT